MLKLQVVHNNTIGEESALLVVKENNYELIMTGDCYHDKIEERIEGFYEGLKYSGTKFEVIDDDYIDSSDIRFSLSGFYNYGENDDEEDFWDEDDEEDDFWDEYDDFFNLFDSFSEEDWGSIFGDYYDR